MFCTVGIQEREKEKEKRSGYDLYSKRKLELFGPSYVRLFVRFGVPNCVWLTRLESALMSNASAQGTAAGGGNVCGLGN